MAIITEHTNYSNTDIPFLKRDDFIDDIIKTSVKNTWIIINGVRYENKKTYDGSLPTSFKLNGHISSYVDNEVVGQYITHYAIKSKKNSPTGYNYITFSTRRSTTGFYDMVIALSKTEQFNFNTDLGLIAPSLGSSIKPVHIAIIEVGEYIGIIRTVYDRDGNGVYGYYGFSVGVSKDTINTFLGETDGKTYDTEFGGISDADGYNPNFDNSSDIIPVPNMPSVGVSNVGFVNVYKTSQGALQNLGADLFPDFVPPPTPEPTEDLATTIAMGFTNVVENLSNLLSSYINSNLINYIIDCHCLPVSPTVGESEPIKIGFKSFPQSAFRVTSDYVDFNCGTLSLKEYYGNFIDYVGTRASLYLPFIGFVPIKNEYFQDGELTVKYRFNIIDGSFMAYVLATSSKSNLKDTVIGTYSGNACVHIPITGVNYSNMVSGLVNGATAIASASKGVGGVAINTALSTLSMKPEMQGNNSYNATSSFLGIRYPYLLIEREVSNFSELYPNEYGVPLNATKTISELTGYVEMDENIHIELNCMDEERQMILELLTGGIII